MPMDEPEQFADFVHFDSYPAWCVATGQRPTEDARRAWDVAFAQGKRAGQELAAAIRHMTPPPMAGRFGVDRDDARWNGECFVHSLRGTTCGTACLCAGARG